MEPGQQEGEHAAERDSLVSTSVCKATGFHIMSESFWGQEPGVQGLSLAFRILKAQCERRS